MAQHDIVIRGGTVVDGTGAPARTADVAIRDGLIVDVGTITGDAARTIDADGALVWHDGTGTHIPAGTNNLVDATGAGDSFAGSFLSHYLRHGDPVAAARHATTISAWVIERLGARPEPTPRLRTVLAANR